MTKKTIKNSNVVTHQKQLRGVLSAGMLLVPFLVISGCNEPTTQASATDSVDDFQSLGTFDQSKLKLSDDPIQIGLPTEIAAFKAGVNSDLAQLACADCHSADYPTTQPVMPRAKWHATIAKMHDKFGAPWDEIFGTTDAAGLPVPAPQATIDANLKKIEDYLVANYGKEI